MMRTSIFDRAVSTDPLELTLLEHAQQLHLKRHRHVSDFVEKYRAAVGLFEPANTGLYRTSESAFHVTEQLRFQQVLRNRTAIDADHFLVFALAVEVDRFRNELFSRSRFALDENGTVETRNGIHEFEDAMHGPAGTNDVVEAVFLVELFPQVLVLKPEADVPLVPCEP